MFDEYEDYEDYLDDAEEFEKDNSYDDVPEEEDERYVLSPWGCMWATAKDYNIDLSHMTPKMGEHFVDDFMKAMETAGYLVKGEQNERKNENYKKRRKMPKVRRRHRKQKRT